MEKCKIVENPYLHDGNKGWPGNRQEAQLVLYNGSFSKNVNELFESYEMGENLLPLLKDCNYNEVICSALSFYYHKTTINSFEWARILSFLLFPYNKTTSSFVLSFLKNNFFFIEVSQKEIISGARFLLTEVPPNGVRLHNLVDFLSFLQIPETDKNLLMEESRRSKSYTPVLRYLQNRNNILLDTESDLEKEKKKKREKKRGF